MRWEEILAVEEEEKEEEEANEERGRPGGVRGAVAELAPGTGNVCEPEDGEDGGGGAPGPIPSQGPVAALAVVQEQGLLLLIVLAHRPNSGPVTL